MQFLLQFCSVLIKCPQIIGIYPNGANMGFREKRFYSLSSGRSLFFLDMSMPNEPGGGFTHRPSDREGKSPLYPCWYSQGDGLQQASRYLKTIPEC
jgi:hypothetical protein